MKYFFKKNKKFPLSGTEGTRPELVEGFTLVELLVAMSVFIIVLTLAVAVFVNALRSQRFLTKLMAVNNNAGLVLEQMAREMRTGYKFIGSASCSPSISFSNSQDTDSTGTGDATTEYRLVNGSIQRTESYFRQEMNRLDNTHLPPYEKARARNQLIAQRNDGIGVAREDFAMKMRQAGESERYANDIDRGNRR